MPGRAGERLPGRRLVRRGGRIWHRRSRLGEWRGIDRMLRAGRGDGIGSGGLNLVGLGGLRADRGWRSCGVRSLGVGGANGGVPGAVVEVIGEVGLPANVFLALQQELGEIGEIASTGGRNQAGGDQVEELAHNVINVGMSAIPAGQRSEFVGNFLGLKDLQLLAGVE